METYEKVEIIVVVFENQDVITDSNLQHGDTPIG